MPDVPVNRSKPLGSPFQERYNRVFSARIANIHRIVVELWLNGAIVI